MKFVEFSPNPESNAHAVGYLHEPSPEMKQRTERPCVVVYPGGGYQFLSDREAEPVAMKFYAAGYQTFILDYSVCKQASGLRPLEDGALTLMTIREHSAEWHIKPDQIAVLGFSAGGHAAGSIGTLWDCPQLKAKIDTKNGLDRPDAMILCYPVITAGPHAHEGSIQKLCGGEPTPEQREFYSLEKQVTDRTPPAFLWHTADDGCVPVENSLLFAASLQVHKIPFECHIFRTGQHGMSLCNAEVNTPNTHNANWLPLCLEWLSGLFGFAE